MDLSFASAFFDACLPMVRNDHEQDVFGGLGAAVSEAGKNRESSDVSRPDLPE